MKDNKILGVLPIFIVAQKFTCLTYLLGNLAFYHQSMWYDKNNNDKKKSYAIQIMQGHQ